MEEIKKKVVKFGTDVLNNKAIGGIILSLIVLFGVFYYATSFIKNQFLHFSKEDWFILLVIGSILIIMSILIIWLIIDRQKLYKLIGELIDNIAEDHHNDVIMHRSTQEIIMELCGKQNKVGDKNEKK